jgi:Zn-dependent M28 family amino/carboxypeptidase
MSIMPKVRRRSVVALCVLLTLSAHAQSARAPHIESITERELRADLFFLASDALQGRLTNTPGNAIAADWVLSQFEGLGLRGGGQGGGFEHRYALMTASLGDGNAMRVGAPTAILQRSARAGEDFYPHRYSANATITASLMFVGFGIFSSERGHDDYADALEGRGHIALMLDREPGVNDPSSQFDGVVTSEPSQPIKKVLAAQAKGAVGVIFVEDVHNQAGPPPNFPAQAANYWPPSPPRVERYTLNAWSDRVRIPVVQVSRALAEELVAPTGRSLMELAKTAEKRGGVTPLAIDTIVSLTTSVSHQTVPDRSIVGVLEGSDAKLKDEFVLISAHFDHEGADGPRVFNGADDDGSGTVGLTEIAEAFSLAAAAGQRPRRSVIFAAWNSEERGLLGAWAYTEDPIVPLDRIAAVLNMDMIGRNEEVQVGGGTRFRGLEIQTAESNANATNIIGTIRSPDLRRALEAANQETGLELKFRYDNNQSNLMRRSDHWPFIQRGVPAVWVHTGLHPDYHTVADRPEKINYPKMEKIARMVYQAGWNLANAATRPALREPGEAKTPSSSGADPRAQAAVLSDITDAQAIQDQKMTAAERAEIIELLQKSERELMQALDGLTDQQWAYKPGPDRWSVAEVMEHIVLADALLFETAVKSLDGAASPKWAATLSKTDLIRRAIPDRSRKVDAPAAIRPKDATSRAQLLVRFKEQRSRVGAYVRDTDKPLKAHTSANPFFGDLNAHQWLIYIPLHHLRHNQQILEVKASPGYPR